MEQLNTKTNSKLWKQLSNYQVAAPQSLLFVKKLQIETGWDKQYCLSAIEEYKKFLYLACISITPVTPSKVIDTVWHLHLTFSRSYWNDLCDNILQKPIHHDPSEETEEVLMQDQYQYTLTKYADEFGEDAPEAIWKDKLKKTPIRHSKLFLMLSLLFGSSYVYADSSGSGFSFFIVLGVLGFFGFLIYKVMSSSSARHKGNKRRRGRNNSSGGGSCGSSCSSSSGGGSSCGGGGGD